ncbi:MAG: type II toxin-antitoxin system VapC family toxin [Caldilineaceae bacterium]|mgnify:CR=1 FL=1|nr:type II toxin-antitoxin system VapC family toxin [Caldilineaceae bacterium]
MSHYYIDTSALLKRYLVETGSSWVRSITDAESSHAILISELTLAEAAAGIAARSRMPGGISNNRRIRILGQFLRECDERYDLLATNRIIIDRAVDLTQKFRLRGYDAVQLATALIAQSAIPSTIELRFVTNDRDLGVAATAEGLEVDNPSDKG